MPLSHGGSTAGCVQVPPQNRRALCSVPHASAGQELLPGFAVAGGVAGLQVLQVLSSKAVTHATSCVQRRLQPSSSAGAA